MKLRLVKSQRTTGTLSKKIVFSLGAQVDLTAQEQDMVSRYQMGREIVYNKDRVNPELNDHKSAKGMMRNIAARAMNINLTVNDLVKGRVIECKDISEIIDAEASVKTACAGLKNLLETCGGFEGEEVIDY